MPQTLLTGPPLDRAPTAPPGSVSALLPGMKPNAPRRNFLVAMAYVLLVGSLYWLGHLLWSALGFAVEAIARYGRASKLPLTRHAR